MHGNARDRLAHGPANPEGSLARALSRRQPRDVRTPELPPGRPHAFLLPAGVSAAALEAAEVEARGCGAAVHEVLIASGRVSPEVRENPE